MATEIRETDVLVIGAGVAGLTAAYRLRTLRPACRVLVVEAKDRVGGRTYTVDLKAANGSDKWDLGGQWNQHHILWLLEELGIGTYEQHLDGRKLMQLGGHNIKSHKSSLPAFSYLSLMDMGISIYKLEQMVRQVPRHDPRECAKADEWDSKTLESLINSISWTNDTREAMALAIECISGVRAREMSALHFLHYSSSAGSFENLIEDHNGGAQEWKVTGGVQQVCELLAERVGRENALLSEPVAMIDQSDKSKVEITTKSGKRFTCKYVINASPLHCSVAMDYKPSFPQTRQSFADRSPMGHLFKFIITYKRAFWRKNGFSGEITSNGGPSDRDECDSGPIALVYDSVTAYDNPALVGFYANGWQWRTVEFDQRRAAVLKHLSQFLGAEAAEPLEFIDKDWTVEPFTGGCPVNIATPGAITTFYDGVRTPLDRVHWAGTESATVWNGYLSGAVQSGMRAAEEVLARIDPGYEADGLLEDLDQKMPPLSRGSTIPLKLICIGALVAGACAFAYKYW